MRRSKLIAGCTLLGVTVLVAAGCGGSKKSSAMTAQQYVSALNKECTAANSEVRALGVSTIDTFKTNGDKALKIEEDAVAKFKSFTPPSSLSTPVKDFLASADSEVSHLKDVVSAAKAGDQAKYQAAIAEAQKDNAAIKAAATQIGATACA